MRYATCLVLLVIVAVLTGCASGSALVTGQTRPTIEDHTAVSILTEMPDGAEKIAIVKASSGSGWTQQDSLDYAVDELKKQAAKVGANAVDRLPIDSQLIWRDSNDGGESGLHYLGSHTSVAAPKA